MSATTPPRSSPTSGGEEIATRGGLVVGIDGSQSSQVALDWAMRDAAGRGCDVHAIAAFDLPEYVAVGLDLNDAQFQELRLSSAQKQVHVALASWPTGGELDPPPVTVEAIPGPAGSVLLGAARSAEGLLIGHRARGELRSAVLAVPVTVVRPPDPETKPGQPVGAAADQRPVIVVGVDGSPGALDALRYALAAATRWASRVVVVAAGPVPRARGERPRSPSRSRPGPRSSTRSVRAVAPSSSRAWWTTSATLGRRPAGSCRPFSPTPPTPWSCRDRPRRRADRRRSSRPGHAGEPPDRLGRAELCAARPVPGHRGPPHRLRGRGPRTGTSGPRGGPERVAAARRTDRLTRDVWPWIAQLGQGRGGFYSYDRLEEWGLARA